MHLIWYSVIEAILNDIGITCTCVIFFISFHVMSAAYLFLLWLGISFELQCMSSSYFISFNSLRCRLDLLQSCMKSFFSNIFLNFFSCTIFPLGLLPTAFCLFYMLNTHLLFPSIIFHYKDCKFLPTYSFASFFSLTQQLQENSLCGLSYSGCDFSIIKLFKISLCVHLYFFYPYKLL